MFFAQPIDYIEAYHAALVEKPGEDTVFSYGQDVDHIPGVSTGEP